MPQRPGRTFTTTDGRIVTLRMPSGSRHEAVTPAGSRLTIDTRRDEYGRGSSHALWGTIHNGRHVVLSRNVPARDVIRLVRHYETHGIRNVTAGIEAF